MKAPEKIWVHELSAKELNVPLKEYHVEYISADAFIEKAAIWFNNNFIAHYDCGVISYSFDSEEEMFNDFIEYMKGE